MTKPSPLQTDSEAPYFSDLHSLPPLSPVQRGQLCLNTQKEAIKWWVLGSRETASLESTVSLINLKWCRTEGFLHFLYWIPLLEQMCRDSATLPAPLQPQPHFIHLLPFSETRVMQSQIIHYTLATLSQVEHDRNTGKTEPRSKPWCSPWENSCTWHTHPFSAEQQSCAAAQGIAKVTGRRGWYLR